MYSHLLMIFLHTSLTKRKAVGLWITIMPVIRWFQRLDQLTYFHKTWCGFSAIRGYPSAVRSKFYAINNDSMTCLNFSVGSALIATYNAWQ
jgi:hypothetical protein